MDINRPTIEQEVGTRPWLRAERRLNKRSLLQQMIDDHPDASVEKIVALMAERRVHVSGVLVASELLKRRRNAPGATHDASEVESGG